MRAIVFRLSCKFTDKHGADGDEKRVQLSNKLTIEDYNLSREADSKWKK